MPGADEVAVAKTVNRLLGEQFGLGVDSGNVSVVEETRARSGCTRGARPRRRPTAAAEPEPLRRAAYAGRDADVLRPGPPLAPPSRNLTAPAAAAPREPGPGRRRPLRAADRPCRTAGPRTCAESPPPRGPACSSSACSWWRPTWASRPR